MSRSWVLLAAFSLVASTQLFAATRTFTSSGNALATDKPATIVLLRPDVEVGEMQASGMVQPNAEWTESARALIQQALEADLVQKKADLRSIGEQTGEAAQLVGDYEALHQAVAASILIHKVGGAKLPTKKDRFDWTLGPGTQRLSELTESNYGLFLFVNDSFTSASRAGVQAVGLLGCLVGVCIIAAGGQHIYFASLVELSTGNIVWFNVLNGSKGDVRKPEGAAGMVKALMASMPTQPGAGGDNDSAKP
jgi:hypothetical protein